MEIWELIRIRGEYSDGALYQGALPSFALSGVSVGVDVAPITAAIGAQTESLTDLTATLDGMAAAQETGIAALENMAAALDTGLLTNNAAWLSKLVEAVNAIGADMPLEEDDLAKIWELQTEWIKLEGKRIRKMSDMMTQVQSEPYKAGDEETATRSAPSPEAAAAMTRALEGAMSRNPLVAVVVAIWKGIEIALTVSEIADIGTRLYRKFRYGQAELKALPGDVMEAAGTSLAILDRLGSLPPDRRNLMSRLELASEAVEKVDRLIDLFRRKSAVEDTTPADDIMLRIAQALEDLQFNEQEFELPSGLKISQGGKLLGV